MVKTTQEFDISTIKVFIGIDVGDPMLDQSCNIATISRIFEDAEISVRVVLCETQLPQGQTKTGEEEPATGQVCRVWRKLTKTAFEEGATYTVLLGDDVRFLSLGWISEIRREFAALHQEAFTCDNNPDRSCRDAPPVGFGVLCFTDVKSPGFPSFPVLHKTHMEIFPEVLPEAFVNQDADPWIFQV